MCQDQGRKYMGERVGPQGLPVLALVQEPGEATAQEVMEGERGEGLR